MYAYKHITNGNIAVYSFKPSHSDEKTIYADEYVVYQTKALNEEYADITKLHVYQEIRFCRESVYDNKEDLFNAIRNECDYKLAVLLGVE